MRDIRFMGKREDNGEWVEGDLTRYSEHTSYITEDLIENKVHVVLSDTVGQFTGLQDKNGKDIFEHHIVDCPYIDPIFGDRVNEGGETAVIKFQDGTFYVDYYNGYKKISLKSIIRWLSVIGNIIDNPELLKEA